MISSESMFDADFATVIRNAKDAASEAVDEATAELESAADEAAEVSANKPG